jgi:hypothetical protein
MKGGFLSLLPDAPDVGRKMKKGCHKATQFGHTLSGEASASRLRFLSVRFREPRW